MKNPILTNLFVLFVFINRSVGWVSVGLRVFSGLDWPAPSDQ